MKKCLSIVMALMFFPALIPTLTPPTLATIHTGTAGENLTWTLDIETGMLEISGMGEMDNWYDDLMEIGPPMPWGGYRNLINDIRISDGVTSIGDGAFWGCVSLSSVTIPDSVTVIGSWAFQDCASLTSVTIPNSITEIGSWAFQNCASLTRITISDSVKTIGRWAFSGCASLTNISVDQSNPNYSSENGVLFNKSKTTLIRYPEGRTEKIYSIPNRVATIDEQAFAGSSLTNVTIPNSVTEIGRSAFTSITIPNSVTWIEESAFSGCTALTSITIGEGVTWIGNRAFEGCNGLTTVFYGGANVAEWNEISISSGNSLLISAPRFYYSATHPGTGNTHWRFVGGMPTIWN
jgi:hypothetical protein